MLKMIKTQVLCDVCGQPLPVTIEEALGEPVECVKLSRTKEWDTRLLFPHLCENCAIKIDTTLRKFKDSVTAERLMAEQFAKLNKERRNQLNSKG